MKTLTTPVSDSAAATQSGWVELYDFYLRASIATPWGTTNIIRLCTLSGGFSFFAPQDSPEPSGTQGSAQAYQYWPVKREVIKGDTKFQDDKLQITASNVTSQFAALLALVNWYDTPVVIRKVPLFQTGLTADDCAVLFTGLVDTISITAQALQFSCSSSLGALNYLLPSENMHASCRFRFGDDQCTRIPFLPENYLTGTVANVPTTTTNVPSTDLTQDTGGTSYGTDLVDALADSAITASSEANNLTNSACTINTSTDVVLVANHIPPSYGPTIGTYKQVVFGGGTMPTLDHPGGSLVAGQKYYVANVTPSGFQIFSSYSTSFAGVKPDIIRFATTGSGLTVTSIVAPSGSGLVSTPASINTTTDVITVTAHGQSNGTLVLFDAATLPSPIAAGQTYYIFNVTTNTFQVSATNGGAAVNFTTAGTSVVVSTLGLVGAHGVKASQATGWAFTSASDWGNTVQGYYQIPDAQAGLQNAALKPYIQFDFGSAVTPNIWQVASFDAVQAEQRVRLIEFFSSTDNATWKFETYFKVPRIGGQLFDVLIPHASSARYWRICVRSRWAETLYFLMFKQVSAYSGSRNWWMDGQITFDGNVTAALKGVTRQVLQSFVDQLFCAPLPVAPANGDTFVVKRGCARTFNACAARKNTENYGGVDDLELQNVILGLT